MPGYVTFWHVDCNLNEITHLKSDMKKRLMDLTDKLVLRHSD